MRFEVDIERHYFEECSLKGLEIRIPNHRHIYPTYFTVQITDYRFRKLRLSKPRLLSLVKILDKTSKISNVIT